MEPERQVGAHGQTGTETYQEGCKERLYCDCDRPGYKVITGDENSADQMAHFCNQFDLVCNDLGAAVIYCHHHSKGGQGQKRSMDRPQAPECLREIRTRFLDLIELDISEDFESAWKRNDFTQACIDVLDKYSNTWEDQHVAGRYV